MNQEDATRIAERLENLARHLRAGDLVTALTIAHGWSGAIKATSYDADSGGHRHDTYIENEVEVTVAVPQDPTGEAAFADVDRMRHMRLTAAIGLLDQATGSCMNLIKSTVPKQRRRGDKDGKPPVPGALPEGACESCWQDSRYYSPIAEGVYAKLCRFCGRFKGEYGVLPTRELLDRHHRGQRLSVSEVERALGRRAS